ncbi:MAG: fatty acid desaturase family protein [Acidimicrobiales bacterium]
MATTMVPPPNLLPDVLPTERLTTGGKPVPDLRTALRRIPDGRNMLTVGACWGQALAVVALAVWWSSPIGWMAAFLLMARVFACFNILAHEAAHRLLFSNKRLNDWVGRWVLGYPAFVVTDLYRRGHMAHHRDEFGPDEPDMNLYEGYPIQRSSFRRKLTRDALGVSGAKNLQGLLRGLRYPDPRVRQHARRVIAAQLLLVALAWAAGRPELWLFLWFAPWMTGWRVSNRLRAVAEHGGMTRSSDRRLTTHHVRQSPFARFWIVPYNTGWHLAHHVDPGVPFRQLPALHRLLVDEGWIVPDLVYPNYLALWRRLASG